MATTKGARSRAAKKETAAKKAPAKKKPAAKKAPAKKKPAAKKAAAKKAPAKKKPVAKKTAAKKAPAKKKPAERSAGSRESARKKRAAAKRGPKGSRPAAGAAPAVKAYRPKARMGPEGVMILADDKVIRRAFYGGQQIPSPNDGFLMLLGIRPREDGGATALFECSVSSLRYQMLISKATRTERAKVKEAQSSGDDPDCPRHGPGQRLVRAGKALVCAECGIGYGKV